MAFDHLRVTVEDRIGWLEYNRPPVNAFTVEMVREVSAALEQLLADPRVRVLVLASAVENYFSAGADLTVFDGIGEAGMRAWVEDVHGIVRKMRAADKPLLAAINGTAVGGGLEMTLHCDVRFAAADARLGQPEINIAFIPPIGATQALARLIGRPRAIRYLYEGRLLPAAEALEIGLVDIVVPPDKLRAEVRAYALDLAAKPAGALAAIRRTITEGGGKTFDAGLAMEAAAVVALAAHPEFTEGVRAFLENRKPDWS